VLLAAGCACAVGGALVATALVRSAGKDDAAGASRREYLTPGLILETGARTAACDVLVFTADGKQLLAAGDDKVVRTWDVTPDGLQPSTAYPVLRWPIFREYYGNIYAMALSSDERRVIVAGHGMRIHGFEAAVLDRQTGALVAGLAGPDAGVPKAAEPYCGTIWSIAFSPSGKRVALGTRQGGVWVWDLDRDTVQLVGVHHEPEPLREIFRRVRFVAFDGETHVVSVSGMGQVVRWGRPGDGTTAELFRFDRPVASVALSRDGRWIAAVPELLAADTSGAVQLLSFPDARVTRRINLPGHRQAFQQMPHRAAFSADARTLAVAMRRVAPFQKGQGGASFFREKGGQVFFFDLTEQNAQARPGPEQALYVEALALHPKNLDLLALAGGEDHEVQLWDTRAARAVGEAIRSPGHCLWGVALDPAGRYLAFQEQRHPDTPHPNARGQGPWRYFDLDKRQFVAVGEPEGDDADTERSFDLDKRQFVAADVVARPFAPKRNADSSGGWTVSFSTNDKGSAAQWYVKGPYQDQLIPLPWDEPEDEFPRCYAFIAADKEKGRPVRLVVGHYWGASVFDLTAKGVQRSRVFKGQEGYVSALAVSAEGRKLVTVSRDQTIAGWSLEDWKYQPALGASFFIQEGKLLVDQVDAGSPAWEAGLDPKDEIVYLAADGKRIYCAPEVASAVLGSAFGTIEKADAALRSPRPGSNLDFVWKRGGVVQPRAVARVIDRPIWRMFPSGNSDWILWQWRDYYYDCSASGDFQVGWQRSYDLAAKKKQKPDFYRAEQFRKQYYAPARVAKTLARWAHDGPGPTAFLDIEPPEVTVQLLDPAGGLVGDAPVRLKVLIRPRGPPGKPRPNQEPRDLLLWVNDHRAEVKDARDLQRTDDGFEFVTAIEAGKFRHGENLLTAQCYSIGGFRGESPPVPVRRSGTPPPPNLYGLIVGAGDYGKVGLDQLYAREDAEALKAAWDAQEGKLFAKVQLKLLVDEQITRKAVLDELDRLRPMVGPDDLLVLHLGGHGTSLEQLRAMKDDKGKRLVGDDKLGGLGRFLFCCPDLNFNRLADTTIGFDELYGKLVKLPCHKLILIDACHSGAAQGAVTTEEAPIRILTQDGIGPVILAACTPQESAIESTTIDLGRAHGLFTIALRRMLEDKKAFVRADQSPKDGSLSAQEVAAAVKAQVKDLVTLLRDRGFNVDQNPSEFVPTLEARLPLMRWDSK
jgi:WD40 repeat protein